MFLAAVTTLAVAAMVTLFSAHTDEVQDNSQASHNSEQVITSGRYTQFNGSTVRFVN
jgi:hypothetical protein